MVEVFKTNVENCEQAKDLLDVIHNTFINYRANFDLEDCDKVLRIECKGSYIESDCILHLLKQYGYKAEILQDIVPARLRNSQYSLAFIEVF
jgi:hypothetical protein